MFIELTDHLRCPRPHAEAFLVLLPDRVIQRQVQAGHLGCPICGWSTAWDGGPVDFGDGWRGGGIPPYDADSAHAMLGLQGAGGWVALVGNAGALAEPLGELLAGVSLVAVNPPAQVEESGIVSVILSGAWPLKSHSMRGVVLGSDVQALVAEAMRSTLPGLRTVGTGEPPGGVGVTLLGEADGVWVVKHL